MFLEILCTDFGEMEALQKFRFTAATLAMLIIPFATMLTAANLSQSYQITTHCTTEFVSIHSISKTALAMPCWWLCIIIIIIIIIIITMINLELLAIKTSSDIAIVLVEGSPFAHCSAKGRPIQVF